MFKKLFYLIVILFFFFLSPFVSMAQGVGYEVIDEKVFFDEMFSDFIDADTFENINSVFAKDKNFCIYKNEKLNSCRVKFFEVLGSVYSKDDYYVFYGNKKIDGADAETFTFIGDEYARDRSHVYYMGEESEGVKSDSFILLEKGYAKDSSRVYFKNKAVANVDQNTIKVISENYIKDAANVYFNNEIVIDADPDTFQIMSEGYASDKSYYFHNGKAVAKITNQIYNRYKIKDLTDVCYSENLDTETAVIRAELDYGYSFDENCIFFHNTVLDLSHSGTFTVIDEKLAKDKNFVYYIKDDTVFKIPFAHSGSFKDMGDGYYKDSYAVYYGEEFKTINGADVKTFRLTCSGENCNYQAEDANRFYSDGIEIGIDEKTKQMIGEARMLFASSDDITPLLSYNRVTRNLNGEVEASENFLNDLVYGVYGIESSDKQSVLNFVFYGTETTRTLGAGERAGVVNSYKTAFGKLPTSDQEWTDVIKIANGRWPTERNEVAEERAERRFRYIYHRTPLSNDQFDNAAITIMAYGLRTAKRNTENEKAAIITFRKMFLEYPVSSSDWDMVRAIAYSGASR